MSGCHASFLGSVDLALHPVCPAESASVPHAMGAPHTLHLTDGDALAAGGLDSLSAVELSSSLSTALGLQLPSTLAFDYPSAAAMAQHIHSLMAPTQQSGGPAGAEAGLGTVVSMPVALPLGAYSQPAGRLSVSLRLAARLPAGNLNGGDAIGLVPFGRWDLEALQVSTAGSL